LAKKIKIKIDYSIPLLLLFFGIIFRFNNINTYYPWGDECYSILTTLKSAPFMDIFNDPGNPPFYFFILKIPIKKYRETIKFFIGIYSP
jgi:hypothetical protein